MSEQLKVLMLGAHQDDNDFLSGGIALKYIKAGHRVRFLTLTDGRGGHHEMSPEETVVRRRRETQAVAEMTGIEYDVWDEHDCELVADLETRKKLVRYIREYDPDIIFAHRTNDYHADHRNAALLVQDASYLLIVPNFCPEAPAMKKTPVIMQFYNRFKNPEFHADIAIDIDDVIDKKYEMYNCHVSQVYEWLPFASGTIDQVPSDPAERLEWLRSPRVPRDRILTLEELTSVKKPGHHEHREATYAAAGREALIERYGEAGKKVIFAEVFETSPYGAALTEEKKKILFPF